MMPKVTDSKGRVSLGAKYAHRHVLVEEVAEGELRVVLARVIPEREAWLYENAAARRAAHEGLKDAAGGRFAEAPDLGE